MDGFIAVNKPVGMSSHDVCFKIKKMLALDKVGHAGTLDPMAQGVLLVMLGNAARLSEYLITNDKQYVAGIKFGVSSDTQDIWGTVLKEAKPEFTSEQFYACIKKFTGKILQTPPMYSAVKHEGKHLYDYARKGVTIQIPSREIEIYALKIISENLPWQVEIKIDCSKGTYIRTLCSDIGDDLGCGALMSSLVRTKAGEFSIENAYDLDQIQVLLQNNEIDKIILPLDFPLKHFERVDVKSESRRIVLGGNLLIDKNLIRSYSDIKDGAFLRIYLDNLFIGIGEKLTGKGIKPVKVFHLQ